MRRTGNCMENYITDLTEYFLNEGHFVVMPVDVHDVDDPYHPETKQFPPHNIRGYRRKEFVWFSPTIV